MPTDEQSAQGYVYHESELRLPSRDFESHHNQLINDKSRKRDSHNVQELILEENKRHNHDSTT
jgi:hypothetical protein